MLQHQAVVCGDVGLTFRAVDDDGVGLADCGTDLDVGGEARAAHTGAARVANDVDDLLGSQGIHVFPGLAVGVQSILEIVLDHHGHRGDAAGAGTGLNSLDGAGDTGVDGRAQSGRLADHLTDHHGIALGDHGLTGGADMHRHRNDHLSRGLVQGSDRFMLAEFLVLGGVNAAVKQLLHSITSVFPCQILFFPIGRAVLPGTEPPGPFFRRAEKTAGRSRRWGRGIVL